jgi:quinol---cytochrome c reductase iron-sulfur subunit, bacillus type
MSQPAPSRPQQTTLANPTVARRGFLTNALAVVIGAVAGFVPLASGLAVFFDPLRRTNRDHAAIRVATLESVPADGVPREFPVVAERVDAWNRSLEPIGAVYLRRVEGSESVECLTATCPHAGCFVSYDSDSNSFKCPCHNSSFQVDGSIIEPSPSPRPMDSLECSVRDQEILVKFQSFYSGTSDKVAKL